MTVSSETYTPVSVAGDDSTLSFAVNFQITSEDDLLVRIKDADGDFTTKAIDTNYTVTGSGNRSGQTDYTTSNVVFNSGQAPLSTETVVITRVTDKQQSTQYLEARSFPSITTTVALDKLTLAVQDLKEEIDRCVKIDPTISGTLGELTDSLTADYYLRRNTDNDGWSLDAGTTGNLDAHTLTADSGSVSVEPGDSIAVVGGTDVTTSISGSTLTITYSGSGATDEQIQDIAGAMWTGNTETGITITYQDADGTIDAVVSDTTVAGDSGSTGITPGDTLTIAGGTNCTTAMSGDTLTVNVDDSFLSNTGDIGTGSYDFGGADDFEIPNSATPTVDTDGQIAIDTTVTDFSHGILKYYSGEEMAVVAVPIAQLTSPTDTYVVKYNATADEFQLAADSGAAGGDSWTDAVDSDIVPTGADGLYDLGTSTDRFAELHIDSFEINGSTTITGFTGTDATIVSGTAGTSGDLAIWDANGDIVDGPTPPSGTIVGHTDTQTLTNKTISLTSNTVSGTTAEFNTALSDGSFATLAGTETLTNKTIDANSNTITDLPYDVAFVAGYDSTFTKEDLVVQTYAKVVMTRTGEIVGDVGALETAATGAALVLDIEKNGTTIFSTKPQFAASSTSYTSGTLKTDGTEDFVSGDVLTFKITQIGSTTAGQGVTFTLKTEV